MKRTVVALLAISLVACKMNYEKTPSGLAYKIFSGKGTQRPKPGEFVKFNLEYKLEDRDSILQSTYGSIPAYSALDTGKRTEYTYMEILPLMNLGDSAEISISIDSLKNKGMIADYNPVLVKGQVLIARIKLLQIFKDEKSILADYQKSMDDEKNTEIKSIEAYLAKNNLKAQKTKNGAFVIVENPGDQTLKADSGKLATVMYRGYLQSNGKVFDTNMDSTKGHMQPYQFAVGSQGAIQGFSEGLPYFGKGGKGKIFIPAMLGYGPQAQGADIPAFSNLIFDIEVTNVGDIPAQQANPSLSQEQMQQMMQQQQQQKDSSHK
jgi:FKBP-type peptidyl-prolyl cis-trans isomerase FkpA